MLAIQNELTADKQNESFNASVDGNSVVNFAGDIQFDNVSFSYPARPNIAALQNLNLVARAGETTALVGLSGSGKVI